MEFGPFPIGALPIATIDLHRNRDDDYEDDDDGDGDEDDDDDDDDEANKSRSINHTLRQPPMASPYPQQWNDGGRGGGVAGPPGASRFLRNSMFRKRKSFGMDEEEGEEEEGVDPISELASVVRAFGEGFVRIENMKMEMMKETEKYRVEMESKRTEMIIKSQRQFEVVELDSLEKHQRIVDLELKKRVLKLEFCLQEAHS
ncbi:protein FIP2-like [Macadamia integrifolia]|uniref:protein FIP2-like n=1 Tax=Macadamia integrifolia TaxID=60698 RepID=UPI001C4F30D5|nr:protein FIP2-like [Macadamia integrifolia]